MGGGQPLNAGAHTREARMQGLYKADVNTQIKKSDENPMVQSLYEGLLKGKTHELLHRNFAEAEKEKINRNNSVKLQKILRKGVYSGV